MASVNKDPKTNKWYVRYNVYDNKGNRHQKMKKGFKSKKEAQIYGTKQEEITYDINADMPFADYFEKWFYTYKETMITDKVIKEYKHLIKLVHEYFGNLPLKLLTRQRYQTFINIRGKNRARNTVEKTHFRLKQAIQMALADNLIQVDPTFNVVISYDNDQQSRIKAWNIHDGELLTKAFQDELTPRSTALYIAINTGLRLGEIYGLSWDDIHGNVLEVNRGYDYTASKTFTAGKTKTSIRKIKITDTFKKRIFEYKLKFQSQSPKFLFLDKFENPVITDTAIRKYLKKLCESLSIEFCGIHGLRHTHCSYLIYNGIDINYISKRLGHASTIETLKTYAHILNEFKQQQDTKVIEILENTEQHVNTM